MSSIEVYQLVERRRHFLSLVYAMATIATFQLCLSAGWYSYLSEAYYHMVYNSEHFFHCCGILAHFIAICLLYMAMFVRQNVVLGFLIVLYFIQFALKLIQISSMYPNTKNRAKFFPALRHSEYDTLNLMFDSVIVVTSIINLTVAACSAFHFTPLVILALKQEAPQQLKMSNSGSVKSKKQKDGTLLVVKSSHSAISSQSSTGTADVNVNLKSQ